MPVDAMIFRRLKAVGADRVYHFPELGIVELAPADDTDKPGEGHSVSQAAVAESPSLRHSNVVPRSSGSGGGTARGECASARGGDGPATACDRAPEPAVVRALSTRLAARVKAPHASP